MSNSTRAPKAKRLSTSAKAALITIPVVLLGVLILILVLGSGRAGGGPAAGGEDGSKAAVPMLQANTHLLSEGGEGAPTLVEFMDFECGACSEVYRAMEDIREEYSGRVNFAIRYFPLPGHLNSMHSALAVEAAAQQGEFEAMYKRVFDTLGEWGGKEEPESARFRSFAEELGLDMAAYDAAVADPATQARIEEDFEAGQALGVQGTPSFFLDGEPFRPSYVADITEALDEALAARK